MSLPLNLSAYDEALEQARMNLAAHMFTEELHPRVHGKFAKKIGSLKPGESVHLPDKTSVHRLSGDSAATHGGAYWVKHDGKNAPVHSGHTALPSPDHAAKVALDVSAQSTHEKSVGGKDSFKDFADFVAKEKEQDAIDKKQAARLGKKAKKGDKNPHAVGDMHSAIGNIIKAGRSGSLSATDEIDEDSYAVALSAARSEMGLAVFEESLHPRLHGKFTKKSVKEAVRGLKHGESVSLPSGVSVHAEESPYSGKLRRTVRVPVGTKWPQGGHVTQAHDTSVGVFEHTPTQADGAAGLAMHYHEKFKKGELHHPDHGRPVVASKLGSSAPAGQWTEHSSGDLEIEMPDNGPTARITQDEHGGPNKWSAYVFPSGDTNEHVGRQDFESSKDARQWADQQIDKPHDIKPAKPVTDKETFGAVTRAVTRLADGDPESGFSGSADEIREVHRVVVDPTEAVRDGLEYEAESVLHEIADGTEHSSHPDDKAVHAWAKSQIDELNRLQDG